MFDYVCAYLFCFGCSLFMGDIDTFPQRDPALTSLIRTATSDILMSAFDTIATDEAAAICTSVCSSRPGSGQKAIYVCTLDLNIPAVTTVEVEKRFFVGYTVFGEDFIFEGERAHVRF